ncbi:MAG TPA: DUF6443 domain-containing protein, partial [Chitinophagaceae bacterium]|nr:DUF6443 domain-containing protein [Chitinophagaceae bacterium]
MKRIFYTTVAFFFFLVAQKVVAQVSLPAAYSGSVKVNYVRTWDATAPLTNPNDVITGTLQQVKQTTQYFDGLGRPLQIVVKKGSMVTDQSPVDLVASSVYDEFGRERYKYSPSPANNTGGNTSVSDGLFKLNPFQQQEAFYNTSLAGQTNEVNSNKNWAYGQVNFEASPLNRILEIYAPGVNWAGTSGQGSEADRHATKSKYWINTSTDSVRIWNVTDVSGQFGTYSSSAYYPAGELTKNVTQDEHNKQVIQFNDKSGRMILKKVQWLNEAVDTGTGKGHYGWICIYYIYDDFGHLRAMFQPEGVKALVAGSWTVTSTILDEQCFRYEYDERERLIMKKVPGAGEVLMVYDARDRIVLTQDANMRNGSPAKWMYTLYDVLNRPKETGLWTNSNTRAYHAGQAAASTSYPNLGGQTIEEMTKTFYDDYGWRSSEGNPLNATRSTSYDSYLLTPDNGNFPYPQNATVQSGQLIGMVTGTKKRMLGTNNFLYTVTFYDDKGSTIQVQSNNISGGTDIITTQYSWSDQPLLSVIKTEKAGTNSQTSIVLTKMTYDDLGRLTETQKKTSNSNVSSGGMPGSWTSLSKLEYDALGQLKKKKLAPAYNSNAGLETLTYDYNIRGWTLGMNRKYLLDNNNGSYETHYFGFDLGYDKYEGTGSLDAGGYFFTQYNGNITGMIWKSTGDDVRRKYDYEYDNVNRFGKAYFNQTTTEGSSSGAWNNTLMDYSVHGFDADNNYRMKYDYNGNILSMIQKGIKGVAGNAIIDALHYTYITGSNRLKLVSDDYNDETSKLGDFKYKSAGKTSQDYYYDDNGNLVKDLNKEMQTYAGANGIEYTHLNLPKKITVKKDGSSNKGTIEYTYDATGVKLKKVITEPGVTVSVSGSNYTSDITTTTSYIATAVYESKVYSNGTVNTALGYVDRLQFINHEEGRTRFSSDNNTLNYDYMIKDHLGNVRMVLTEEQQTDAYPVASLEITPLSNEQKYYGGLTDGRVNKSGVSGYPNDTYTNPNDFIQQLNGSGTRMGSNALLKVMAGDKFNLRVNSWWNSGNT